MIRSASDRTSWDDFLASHSPPTFLQSWEWGETQKTLGEQVIRLEATESGKIVGVAQAVTVRARRATFLHVPHGPVVRQERTDVARALLEAFRDEAKRRALPFLRVSPMQEQTEVSRQLYRDLGFRAAPIHLHAERLWVLDLSPTEEALLGAMRKTTRNLIRRAEREGVHVRSSASRTDLPNFLRLYAETARRERFVPFSERALEAEFEAFAADGNAVLFFAEHEGTILASALVPFAPWSGFYHHGASSRLRPQIPAATALQWAAIREAKRRGCASYNFWGISSGARHPWAGLTLFKTGFGGREISLLPTQDLPLSLYYWPVFFFETARRWKRSL